MQMKFHSLLLLLHLYFYSNLLYSTSTLLYSKILKRGAKTQLEDSLKDSAAVQVYIYKTRESYLMLLINYTLHTVKM